MRQSAIHLALSRPNYLTRLRLVGASPVLAIATHPLARLLIVRQSAAVWDFADAAFAHPLNPESPKITPQEHPKT
jgi:hypothetical protein